MKSIHSSFGTSRKKRNNQRGVVLIFSLIALTVMLIGAVALISSFNTTLLAAGNIGFKRDLQNQSERAVAEVFKEFTVSGASLDTPNKRANNILAQNYSAVQLATNAQGIPFELLNDATFIAAGFTRPDINPGNEILIRYLVDRLCSPLANGVRAQAAEDGLCVQGNGYGVYGMDESHVQGDSANQGSPKRMISNGSGGVSPSGIDRGVKSPVVYRITARVKGPRNVESYFQTTFSEPLP